MDNLGQVCQYAVVQFEKDLKNVIIRDFFKILEKFVRLKYNSQSSTVMTLLRKGAWDRDPELKLPTMKETSVGPKIVCPLAHDINVQPFNYYYSFIKLVVLTTTDHEIVPMTTSHSFNYYRFDTSALLRLSLPDMHNGSGSTKTEKCLHVSNYHEWVFQLYFDYSHHVFTRRNHHFNYQLVTDGVGCNLVFQHGREGEKKKKGTKGGFKKREKEERIFLQSLDDDDLRLLHDKTIVGVDPGKKDIGFFYDGVNQLHYSAARRQFESNRITFNKILNQELLAAKAMEVQLFGDSEEIIHKTTLDCATFQLYITKKLLLHNAVENIYANSQTRLFNFIAQDRRASSIHLFVNQLKETWPPEKSVLVFGSWLDDGLRGSQSTMGISFQRKLQQAGYKVYILNEAYTSATCFNCWGSNERFLRLHRLVRCSRCETNWNRDLNGASNIRHLALECIYGKERDPCFRK